MEAPACDQELLMSIQRKLLAEMRNAQVQYFDSKMLAVQEIQADIDRRMEKLQEVEKSIYERERGIADQLSRLELEKTELNQIRQLLRVENESIRLSSKDLKDQIRKYEIVIKMMMRPPHIRLESAIEQSVPRGSIVTPEPPVHSPL